MKKILLLFIIIIIIIPVNLYAQAQFGLISEVVFENYNKASDTSAELDEVYTKFLISFTIQFIWKQERNLALINFQIYGDLGSLAGSFGNQNLLFATLKPDSFYQAYILDSFFYFKAGKYKTDMPYDYGAFLETGQLEFGYNKPNAFHVYYAPIFYFWGRKVNPDGSVVYVPRWHDLDEVVHLMALDLPLNDSLKFKFRIPVSIQKNATDFRIFPSIYNSYESDIISNYAVLGISYRNDENKTDGINFAIREEFKLHYGEGHHHTSIIAGFIYADKTENRNNTYAFTSLDNKSFQTQIGADFGYIYEQIGNYYGQYSFGVKHEINYTDIYIWAGASFHFTLIGDDLYRKNNFICQLYSAGFKWYNAYAEGSLIEISFSLLLPQGFTVVYTEQQKDTALQIIIKVQQIIF